MFGTDLLWFLLVLHVSCELLEIRWDFSVVKFLLWFQQWISDVLERPVNSSRNMLSSRKRWANRTLRLGCVLLQRQQMVLKKRSRWSETCSPSLKHVIHLWRWQNTVLCGGRVWVYDTKASRFQRIVEFLSRIHSEWLCSRLVNRKVS